MGGRKGFFRKGFVKRKIEEMGKGKPIRVERREVDESLSFTNPKTVRPNF